MKQRLFAVLLLITIGLAAAGHATRQDAITQLAVRLRQTTDPGLCTVAQWDKMDNNNRVSYLGGVTIGNEIARVLANQDEFSLKSRQKNRSLLLGWNQPPSEYAPKVDADLRKTPEVTKSLAASIVRAEALCVRSAGQTTRAQQLHAESLIIEYIAKDAKIDDNIGGKYDKPEFWHTLKGLGLDSSYLQGVRDGIALERYTIDEQFADDNLYAFSCEEIFDEMRKSVTGDIQEKSVLYLFLRAQLNLFDKVTDA